MAISNPTIRLDPRDNVVVARRDISAGTVIEEEGLVCRDRLYFRGFVSGNRNHVSNMLNAGGITKNCRTCYSVSAHRYGIYRVP